MLKVTYENKIHIVLVLIIVVALIKFVFLFSSQYAVQQEIPAQVATATDAQALPQLQAPPVENTTKIVDCPNFRMKKGESVKAGNLTILYEGSFIRAGSSLQNPVAKFTLITEGQKEIKFFENRELASFKGIDISVEIISVIIPQSGHDEIKVHIAGAKECEIV